jgi:hypothetical protein
MTFQDAPRRVQGNYLIRAARNQRQQNRKRRKCSVLFNVFFPRKGVRQICKAQLRVLEICEDGLRATSRRSDIPDHFYVSIGAKQVLVACAVVSRKRDLLEIRFLSEMPTAFVDVVGSLEDPFAFLEHIRPAL